MLAILDVEVQKVPNGKTVSQKQFVMLYNYCHAIQLLEKRHFI